MVCSEKAVLSIFLHKGLRATPNKRYLANCRAYSRPLKGLDLISVVSIHMGGSNTVTQSRLSRSQGAKHTYFTVKNLYVNISA